VALPGHEDWVRGLSFRPARGHLSSLTLASGSADSTIRLWNIKPVSATKGTKSESQGIISDEMLESFEASFKDSADTDDSDKRLSMKRYRITTRQANGMYVVQHMNIICPINTLR
jgi:WD40 repeat protein